MDSEQFFKDYYNFWQRLVKNGEKKLLFQDKIYNTIRDQNPFDIFRRVFTFNDSLKYDSPEEHVANSLYFEIKTFLHGLLLVGDKLSIAHSLEERFPFLDNDLVDFSMKIPIKHKLKNLEDIKRIDENEVRKNIKFFNEYDNGKNVLREAMKDILADEITGRKKQGFSAPDESWYRGENFEYVKDLLLENGPRMYNYINRDYVKKVIDEHSNGVNHRLLIWSFISFEEWCKVFKM